MTGFQSQAVFFLLESDGKNGPHLLPPEPNAVTAAEVISHTKIFQPWGTLFGSFLRKHKPITQPVAFPLPADFKKRPLQVKG